jgi:hypothetical protein
MAFRMSSIALAASLALLAGVTTAQADTPAAPMKKMLMKKPVHHVSMGKMHGDASQNAAVDKLNDQSLAAAQSSKPMSMPAPTK